MKKFLAIILATMLMTCTAMPALAAPAPAVTTEVIILENGYATITTTIEEAETTFSTRATRKASKAYKAYNSSNRLLWTYTLTGQFTYNGSSATATRATDSYSISNSDWSKDYSDTSYSDDTVYGDATFSSSEFEESCSISITCGADGEIY